MRDLYVITGQRLELMLTQDDAVFADWDQDEAARQYRLWKKAVARTLDWVDEDVPTS